ncbi:MAG: hypothetical protein ACREGL_04785 [Alphaproteobacteria bacterium]
MIRRPALAPARPDLAPVQPERQPDDTYPSLVERDRLRAWVTSRHADYIRLATQIAELELSANGKSPKPDISYEKLRRHREEYEEARRTLAVLDQRY